MKIITRLIIAAALVAGTARAGRVIGNLNDLTTSTYSPRVTFVPLSTPLAYQSTNTVLDVPRWVTPTNGLFAATLVGGLYRVEFSPPNDPILILMPPDTTNTYQFNELAALATNVGTFSFSTNMLSFISQRVRPAAGSETSFTTNNPGDIDESLTISVGTANALTNLHSVTVNLNSNLTARASMVVTSEVPASPAFLGLNSVGAGGYGSIVWNGSWTFSGSGGLTANQFVGSGAGLTAINASAINSGTVAPARLGSGSGGAAKFLREDSTWQTVTAGTSNDWVGSFTGDGSGLINLPASAIASGVIDPERLGDGTPGDGKFLSSTGWVYGVETGWNVLPDGSWSNSVSGVYITTNGHIYATAYHGGGIVPTRPTVPPVPTVTVTTAEQLIAAVTNVAPAVIRIAEGSYDVGTNNLVWNDGVHVVGDGSHKTTITGYADCWGRESFSLYQVSGGPQYSPGNNSYHAGLSIVCDTNKMLAAFNALTNSGMWSGFGMSSKNPPAHKAFTNVFARDIWVRRGSWDGFHFNSSNRFEIWLESCGVETEGLCYSIESGTASHTNDSVVVLNNCVGISRGRVHQPLRDSIAYADPQWIVADTRTFVFNSAFYLTTNGTAANLALPGMVRQTGNEIAGKVILQDCSLNNDAGDPQNTFTNLVGSFTYNGTRYIKPPNADGSYTNANFVLWGTNVDGSITNIAAYQAALMQERTEITLSAKGILNGLSATNNDGAMFGPDTPGTTTCGIQEAWNSINKGTEYGPRNVAVSLRFGDGNFFYTNCLVFSNNYTTSIRMEGNDLLSTRLVFAGTAGNTNTLWIRGGGNANMDDGNPALNLPMHFWARHLAFSSILENTNVLVCVTNVSGFQFDQCRFVSWRSMTNNTSGSAVSVSSVGNYPGPQGLVGVVAGNVNDHWGIFTSCSWQGLASGVYLFTDHLMIDGAKFAEVGFVGGVFENNLFPNTSPFSLGAGIIRNNGLDTHITDAHFYSTRIGIAALNFSGVTTPDSLILDGFQTEGVTYDLVAFNTNGIAIYLKDPRLDYTFGKVSTNGAGVYSVAASALDVKTVLYGTGGLTNPSTNLNASAITSGTVSAARLPGTFLWATNSVDGTLTNINGGGVSVGTSKVAITNGGAAITLGVSPGMIRTLNNGVSTIIDSNTITTGNSTNTHVQTSTLRTTSTAHIGGDLTVVGGNVILPNSFQGIIGTRYASYTNGLPANPFAGWSYSTNGASAVTLGLFANVPTTGTTITYVTHSNSSSAAVAFTGPAGTIGPDGSKPAVFYTPAASEVVYGFFHNAQRSTNMFVLFRTNMTQNFTTVVVPTRPTVPPVPTVTVTTAAQLIAAVTNVAPAVIRITEGSYDIGTNNLVWNDGVHVFGDGSQKTTITGYADCWGRESFALYQVSGGPQYSPGNNSYHGGFSIVCDTNKMLGAFNAVTNSGMWSGFGMSSKNPPANKAFTNVFARDIWVRRGSWDGFHFNSSNRFEIWLESCGVETEGLCYSIESGTASHTNDSVVVLNNCVGISRGRVHQPLRDSIAYADPQWIVADTRTFVFNSAFYLTTNGVAANVALPGTVRQTGTEAAGKVILQDCSLNNDAGDPQNTFTNLVGSFTYNGTRYIKPPNADGSYTNANFVLWGTNVDGSITNINGGGVSVGTSKVAITNGGAAITLGVSPGMIRTLNNGVSTLLDSNTITTGSQTNSGNILIGASSIYGFVGDPLTGMGRVGVSRIGFYSGGTLGFECNNGHLEMKAGKNINFNSTAYLDGNGTILSTRGEFRAALVTATNGFSSRSNRFMLMPTNSASANDVVTASGVDGATVHTKWAAGGAGGSQTPWTSDINAAGYDLTNLHELRVSNLVIQKSGANNAGYVSSVVDLLGGTFNTISGSAGAANNTVLGGYSNTFNVTVGTVTGNLLLGGSSNTVQNTSAANFRNSVVLGGAFNVIDSAANSVVGGQRAYSGLDGTFVWSDGSAGSFAAQVANSAIFRVGGGFGINTNHARGNSLSVLGTTLLNGDTVVASNLTVNGYLLGQSTGSAFISGSSTISNLNVLVGSNIGIQNNSGLGFLAGSSSLYGHLASLGFGVRSSMYYKIAPSTAPDAVADVAFGRKGVGLAIITNLTGGGYASLVVGNLTANGQIATTNSSGMTNSRVAIYDGGIHLPSALFGGSYATPRGTNYYAGGLHIWDHGSTAFPPPSEGGTTYTPGMSLKYDSDWGGADTGHSSRWAKLTAPNVRVEPGYGWGYGQLQLLNEDATCALGINWSRGPRRTEYDTANNYLLGQPVQFQVDYTDAATNHYRAVPGLIAASVATNAPEQASGGRMGQLWVQSLAPTVSAYGYQQNGEYAVHHNVVHVFGTNGALSLGRQMSNLKTAYADDTTISIDFAKDRFTRHRLASNTTFTVTGLTPESIWHTNLVYHRTLVLESGATPKTLTWPDEITWVNEAGNAVPPASVAGSNLMEITLRGYYDGLTTNVLASYASGSNKTLVDADLASFLQRTSITDSNMVDALQYLTYSLKRAGLWNNLHVIYPFVGGNSNAHAMNLRSNQANITFTSSGVTHDANGITGNGSSGSGDTGYKFNYAGADTNSLVAVYSRSQTPTDSGRFASVTDGSSRMGLYRNSAAVGFDGPMNNTTGSGINTSTDFRGFLALSRTNSNDYFDAWRTTVTPRSSASVGTIGNNLFVLARNTPPAGFYSDVNLAFACAGHGITPTQYTNLLTIVNRYQTILGRSVP